MPALAVFVDLDGTLVGFDRPSEAITEAAQEAHPRALSALAADAPLGVLANGVRARKRAKLDHVGLNAGVAHIFGR